MNKKISTLFGVLALGLLAGCYADWNQFEQIFPEKFH